MIKCQLCKYFEGLAVDMASYSWLVTSMVCAAWPKVRFVHDQFAMHATNTISMLSLKVDMWSFQSCRSPWFVLLQDALPVLIDLQLRAAKQSPQAVGRVYKKERQTDAADAHFSREYMDVVVGEVQQVLRKADMDVAAQQAQALMQGSALTGSDAATSRPLQAKTVCLLRCAE